MARKLLPENINIQSIEDSWEEGIIQERVNQAKMEEVQWSNERECVRKDEWTMKKTTY